MYSMEAMLLLEKKSIEQYLVRYHVATMSERKQRGS